MTEIDLAEAIEALRQQLSEATTKGKGQALRFAVSSIELQLSVTVTKDRDAHAGIKFWVVDAGAKAEYSSSAVQQVTLSLLPVDEAGEPVRLGDSDSERPA